MMRPQHVVLFLTGLILMSCGMGYRVDRDMLKKISIEYKLTLFDAENDVSIAIDERDKIMRDIRLAYKDRRATEAQIEEAKSDADRASKKDNAKAEQVAEFAEQVFDQRIDYIDMKISYLRDKLDAQQGIIGVALANYEMEKARLVKKNNVEGAEDIDLADYKGQVRKYAERAKEEQKDLEAVAKKLEAGRQSWLRERDKLSKMSGGGIGSTWVEEGVLWGEQ